MSAMSPVIILGAALQQSTLTPIQKETTSTNRHRCHHFHFHQHASIHILYQPVPAPGIALPMSIDEADPVADLDVAHPAGEEEHHLEEEEQ